MKCWIILNSIIVINKFDQNEAAGSQGGKALLVIQAQLPLDDRGETLVHFQEWPVELEITETISLRGLYVHLEICRYRTVPRRLVHIHIKL